MSTITTKQHAQSSPPRGMTVDEFEQFEESLGGVRIELIDGRVSRRDDMNPPHVVTTGRTKRAVESLLPSGRFIRKDEPIRIPDFNEPFPDLAVAHGDLETYADHHPGPEDVSLVIEISDSSLGKDRGDKRINYGRAGIPIYWIVNLVERQIEVYSAPQSDGYGNYEIYRAGEHVPLILDGTIVGRIAVDDIFGLR
jgi:Uma2 family endonuclease